MCHCYRIDTHPFGDDDNLADEVLRDYCRDSSNNGVVLPNGDTESVAAVAVPKIQARLYDDDMTVLDDMADPFVVDFL